MKNLHANIPATPEEVEQFGATLTPAHLYCRVWGHDAAPHNVVVARDVEGVVGAHWDADLICSHGCGVRWKVLASREGEVLRRRPDYSEAKEYLSQTGRIDATGKQVLRKQWFGIQVAPGKPSTKRTVKRASKSTKGRAR